MFTDLFSVSYLNNMFTMDRNGQRVSNSNEFMRSVINTQNFDDDQNGSMAGYGTQPQNAVVQAAPARLIQDESRLWAYRNGGVPT